MYMIFILSMFKVNVHIFADPSLVHFQLYLLLVFFFNSAATLLNVK